MAEPKDNESFFRKVVRFVANPSTDWHELSSRQEADPAAELEKSELKAMIERKRRNDFVRKREFDMLRRVRREGLTPEQLAALGGSSKLDDSEVRSPDSQAARPGGGVKAKIDAIEQQMVGEGFASTSSRRSSGFFNAPTQPTGLGPSQGAAPSSLQSAGHASSHGGAEVRDSRPSAFTPAGVRSRPPAFEPPALADGDASDMLPALPPLPDLDDVVAPPASPAATPAVMAAGLSPLAPLTLAPVTLPGSEAPAVEVSEALHDPELDEAVIAFANADFEQCEQALTRLTGPSGPRAQHAETWLVLFDLFRAVGQQQRFESLAMEYAHQFGWSAPQWFSMPQQVADAAAADDAPRGARGRVRETGDVGWIAPEVLDTDALARLRSQTLQMPLPWIFDWSALKAVDAEAATQLSVLCRVWAAQALEMRWIAGDRVFSVLQESAPTGVRDADPAFWLARLDALRLANRADQFDETAIDYCVTYEVSPPSWEPARCHVQIGGSSSSTRTPPLSMVGEVSTTFFESGLAEDSVIELASVELSGQLIGDINETLRRLTEQLGHAPMVSVSCARLIRVDFLAAGDLLNWVLARRGEGRTVQFAEAHRLIALFFTAMGISEHAQVHVRKL